jgi:hypothetical protein
MLPRINPPMPPAEMPKNNAPGISMIRDGITPLNQLDQLS